MTLEEEERLEAKDQGLDQLLNKLGGSVHGTRITVTPPRVGCTVRCGSESSLARLTVTQ